MLFENIGKVSQAFGFLDKLKSGKIQNIFGDLSDPDNVKKVLRFVQGNILGKMDIKDAAKSLIRLGVPTENLASSLVNLGFNATEAGAEVLELAANGGVAANSFTKLGDSLKNIAIGLAKSPVFWGVLAAGAVAATIAIVAYNNSFDKLLNDAEKSQSVYEETASELESLKSQYKSNRQEIESLKTSTDDISSQDESIEQLERENELIKAKIALKEKEAKLAAQTAAEDAYEALTKNVITYATDETHTMTVGYGAGKTEIETPVLAQTNFMGMVKKRQEELAKLKQEYDDLASEIAEDEKNGVSNDVIQSKQNDLINKATALENKEIQVLENEVQLRELYNQLLNPNGEVKEAWKQTAAEIEKLIDVDGPTTELDKKINEVKDSFTERVNKSVGVSKLDKELLNEDFYDWIDSLSDEDKELVIEFIADTETADWSLAQFKEQLAEVREAVYDASSSPITIETETEGLSTISTALEENVSSTGLLEESIAALESRYKNLGGYNAAELFERTATGVRLNANELYRLEDEYEAINKQKLEEHLAEVSKQYFEATIKAKKYANEDLAKDFQDQADAALEEVNSVKLLIAQYNGLTSAYNEWLSARETPDVGTEYDTVREGWAEAQELYKQGAFGSDNLIAYLELVTGNAIESAQDVQNAYKGLSANISGTSYSITDFLQNGSTGVNNLLKAIQQVDDTWASFDYSTGQWTLNFDEGDIAVADKLGISVEFLHTMLEKLKWYGFDIDIASIDQTYDEIISKSREAAERQAETIDGLGIDISTLKSVDDYAEAISKTEKALEGASKGSQEYQDMTDILIGLNLQKRQLEKPAILQVDTSNATNEAKNVSTALESFVDAYDIYKATESSGITGEALTSAKQAAETALTTLQDSMPDGLDLKLNFTNIDTAFDSIKNVDVNTFTTFVNENQQSVDATVDYQLGDQAPPEDMSAIVNYELGSQDLPEEKTVKVHYELGSQTPPTNYGGQGGIVGVDGTAYANGAAFSRGDWGLKKDIDQALMGELGQEIIVRDGRWFTVGDNGVEFVGGLRKDDIIFNAEQTKQILQNGKITHGKKRGRALASGTVSGSGSAFAYPYKDVPDVSHQEELDAVKAEISTMNDGINIFNKGIVALGEFIRGTTGYGDLDGENSGSGSGGGGNSSNKKAEDLFDWIEVAITRIEEAINRLASTASSAYKTLKTKLGAAADQITLVNEELALQEKAYTRYLEEANSVGLSEDLMSLVQNGTIDISQYDEETQKLIQDYQGWYEKAIACSDAIDELHESLAGIYEDNFDNIQTNFDNQISALDYLTSSYENQLDIIEASGYLDGIDHYKALADVEQQRVATLTNELVSLQLAFEEAMNSGEIEEGSEAYYEMALAITDVKEQIDEARLALIEYNNEVRNLEWERFDFIRERVSALKSESDFLIDLMSYSDLHDDKGNLTDAGMATVGLHAMNYNTYMSEADKYAKELLDVEKQLEENPGDTELIKRKEELTAATQECILAAKEENQAINDLVEEGINLELEALQELIDKYTDALDSAKDLYDYQKKVEDHTSEISSLQKQLLAYEGRDDSEETRARVQELRAELKDAEEELEETEYDKHIDDQKKMLDELYTEYEEVLNERLDNTDALLQNMIDSVNTNSSAINTTLGEVAGDVGYALSENMKTVWDTSLSSVETVVDIYGSDFSGKLTTVNETLLRMETLISQFGVADPGFAGETAIDNLARKGIINTPDYWRTTQNDMAYLPDLLVKLSNSTQSEQANSFDNITDAVNFLSDNGVINTPEYWLNNYAQIPWLEKLLVTAANYTLPKFASGGLASFTGLAQLDGSKNRPELVLNADDTQNFLELKDLLRTMACSEISMRQTYGYENVARSYGVSDLASVLSEIRGQSHENGSTNFGDININIPIDHVSDYNDFVNQLRSDNKFEKMVQDMTVGRLGRVTSLAKNKYQW